MPRREAACVHYAEIGLKGRNRPRFEDGLGREPRARARPRFEDAVRDLDARWRSGAHRCVEAPGEAPAGASVAERLGRVFGVAYFSVATTLAPTREAITAEVDAFVAGRSFASFGVRVRRVDKALPFRSNELAGELGARIQAKHRRARRPRALPSSGSICTCCTARRSCCTSEGRGRGGCRCARRGARWRSSRAASTRRSPRGC